jgi:hypothetical protein
MAHLGGMVANCGHLLHEEQPEGIAQELTRFFEPS